MELPISSNPAIYYPTIDIDDSDWLRSALLYWDRIFTLVPEEIAAPYKNEDSAICEKEGALAALKLGNYRKAIAEVSKRALAMIEANQPLLLDRAAPVLDPSVNDIMDALGFNSTVRMHPEKLGIDRMHSDKVTDELRRKFETVKDSDGIDWLQMDRSLSDVYMAALAQAIAEQVHVPTTTDSSVDHGRNLLALLTDDPAASASAVAERGILVNLTLQKIRIREDVPVQKIIEFRRTHSLQLEEFHQHIKKLEGEIAKCDDHLDIVARAERSYRLNIEHASNKLESELRAANITSRWEGIYRGMLFTVPQASALALAGGQSTHATLIQLGLGAFHGAHGHRNQKTLRSTESDASLPLDVPLERQASICVADGV